MRRTSPVRQLAIAASLLIAVLVACGREITGPVSEPVNVFKRFAAFAFESKVESAIPVPALRAALQQVAFERVRITLRRDDGSIALDTVVLFPAGATEMTLTLNVPLPASAPASGVPLSLNLGYINAAGDTVFKGGPLPVTVTPGTGGTPPAPVQVPVHYTGPGASATAVVIAPKTFSGIPGQSTTFTGTALSASGQVLGGTPVVFFSNNSTVVTVNETTGAATLVGRGTAKVYAQLLTGPLDSAVVTVTLPASALQVVSGGGQTGPAGSTLATPVVARVVASDGIGVGGVTVSFAASGGGTVTPATAVSDASGNVSAQWKLGPAAGAQTLTVASAGLSGSPLSVNATALAVTPTRLAVLTDPVAGKAGVALAAVTVAAQDAAGNTITTYAGDVSVALGVNPGGATLAGTTTVKAVAGVATFSDLRLNRPGTGYTLVFSSAALTAVASSPFIVTTGDASALVFGAMPSTIDPGLPIAPPVTVSAQDAAGNTVTTFTGAVTVAIGANPGSATLGGTVTRTAVAGVASFADLTITKRGSPYTLTASASGLTSGTSAAFAVASGPPTGLSIVSGSGQSAAAGALLDPITVRLHDAFGNGVASETIAFAVTGGGGSLSSATATTDADGMATVLWTIGAGPQTMTATYAGLAPTIITATSTSVVLTWTGAVSSTWNTAGNWSPAVVPTYADDVLIPSGTPNVPTTSAGDGNAHHLTIASGAYIQTSCSYQLYVYGNVVAPLGAAGVQTCEGDAIHLMGDGTPGGNTVVGNFEMLIVEGNYKVSGPGNQVIVGLSWGSLGIDGTNGGMLTLNGGRVDANQLSVYNGGLLVMTNAADQLFIGGDNGYFNGASTTGKLTAGTITVSGGGCLYQGGTAPDAFAPSGTNTVILTGANCVQFADPVNSFFQDLTVNAATTTRFDSDALVKGTLARGTGSGSIVLAATAYPSPAQTLTVNGLNQTGADPMQFVNLVLKLAGSSAVTFNNAAFTGFGPGFAGDALFDVNRSGGALTFTGLDFSTAGFGADTTRHYVKNSGAANITLSGATPSSGVSGIHFIALGTGTVSWP